MHEAGFVHCDVKPANFLLGEHDRIKLIDFDICTPISDPADFRPPRWITASSGYIAYEQRRKLHLDERTDIYSLGMLIHVLLTGKMRFAERLHMTVREQNELPLVPLVRRLNADVSEGFADLLARMLSNDKDVRPRTIPAFLEEFRSLTVFQS